jgi:hypothetical protein
MLDPGHALAVAARPTPLAAQVGAARPRRVLVVGGAGALGEQVLEHLLASACWAQVGVLVEQPLRAAPRGLQGLPDDEATLQAFGAEAAVIVFDRERRVFGRDAAFVRPAPQALPALAARLARCAVRQLVVTLPHTPAMLPRALLRGLANLDEGAVAALGFEQLVLMRLARPGGPAPGVVAPSAPQRLAAWMLSQLHWMVPQREQPVRARTVARLVAAVLPALADAVPGTRILPPQLLWHVAQHKDCTALVRDWLRGRPLPHMVLPRQRW